MCPMPEPVSTADKLRRFVRLRQKAILEKTQADATAAEANQVAREYVTPIKQSIEVDGTLYTIWWSGSGYERKLEVVTSVLVEEGESA